MKKPRLLWVLFIVMVIAVRIPAQALTADDLRNVDNVLARARSNIASVDRDHAKRFYELGLRAQREGNNIFS